MNCVAHPLGEENARLLDRSFISCVVFFPPYSVGSGARRKEPSGRGISPLVQSQKIQPAETDQSRAKIGKRSTRLQRRPGSKTDPSVANSGNLAQGQKLAGCLLGV